MSPKHKLITTVWCAVTMVVTLMLSHGHLIARELLQHWPRADSWEGRFESAIYTQGGLVFIASLIVTAVLLIRGHFTREQDKNLARKELAQRERHERSAAARHEDLIDAMAAMFSHENGLSLSNEKPLAKKG